MTGLVILLLVAPLLVIWPFGAVRDAVAPTGQASAPVPASRVLRRDFALAWLARLFVQMGAAFVLGYLFLYVADTARGAGPPPTGTASGFVGRLSLLALGGSFAAALAGGIISDRLRLRRAPLALFGIIAAGSLLLIALAPGWWTMAVAYMAFNVGLTGFIAVDSALVAQLLAGNPRRGALLGVMNATNTLPAILAPAITLLAIGDGAIARLFPSLLVASALAALAASVLVMRIASVD